MIHARAGGRREYEKQALAAIRRERVIVLFWARRCRKSTNLGAIAFDDMSKAPGQTVIAASASLLLGTELVNMTVSAVEAAIIVQNEAEAQQSLFQAQADSAQLDFRCADSESGKEYSGLTKEDFADLYKSKRLEMRLYFDRTAYSRQLIIAPVPATARGWRGTVLRDEAGFTAVNLEIALREAVDPIFRDVPDLKMIYASNLGRDDRHPFFTMTMPPPDLEMEANAKGHFYRGENRILIHRVSLADAYAAGHVLYDNRGEPMSLQEFRSEPANKGQLPFNYDLEHISGGTAAIDLLSLLTSQQRGIGQCSFFYIDDDSDFQRAMEALHANLRNGRVAAGYDPATTTRDTSNPSSVTFTEMVGGERYQRVVMMWKERKAAVVMDRLRQAFQMIAKRPSGGPARRFCIAATNERYFADLVHDDLAAIVPVELVIESAGLQPPGYEEPINYKTYLGDLYSAAVNENRYALPCGEYFKKDQRMTVKNAGRYECTPDTSDGAHGDSFVSGALAEYGLTATGGAIVDPSGIHFGGNGNAGNRPTFQPRRLVA
ncbi:MAG TPA: hypothetical protein VF614_02255 [Chthoniobacteraceae bacterium]|jgi:hypothetical protein